MTIFSCWNGTCNVLFSSKHAAISYAKKAIEEFRKQNIPFPTDYSQLVTEGAPSYWFKLGHTIEKTIMNEVRTFYVGPSEAPGCIAGDNSPEVAAAVAQWWRDRDARA